MNDFAFAASTITAASFNASAFLHCAAPASGCHTGIPARCRRRLDGDRGATIARGARVFLVDAQEVDDEVFELILALGLCATSLSSQTSPTTPPPLSRPPIDALGHRPLTCSHERRLTVYRSQPIKSERVRGCNLPPVYRGRSSDLLNRARRSPLSFGHPDSRAFSSGSQVTSWLCRSGRLDV